MNFFRQFSKPFVIAGPCSAENREQILSVAESLADMHIPVMRAGVWKPRTRPGSFEGNGAIAFDWLKEAKNRFGIATAVEVAETEHIELALKNNTDILWIGARTTVNPFQVQHLADALRGTAIPVMIKNPVNPDISLWLGAIERFEKAGIKNIAAVHRGFTTYNGGSSYRNTPNWTIPIELKRRRPDLFMICDPSHISGNRQKVEEVAQKAMDMHFDGLMIETHPDPDKAWSDAEQQVTPAQLSVVLRKLIIRNEYISGDDRHLELEHLRQVMDAIDTEVIELIARRMRLSDDLGRVKKDCHMTAYQPERWREIVETRSAIGKALKLETEFVVSLFDKIHHESIKKQLKILQENTDTIHGTETT